jgi:hypothetical protein
MNPIRQCAAFNWLKQLILKMIHLPWKAFANIRVVICCASSYHAQPYDTTHYFEERQAT